jgi:hypothetical protein
LKNQDGKVLVFVAFASTFSCAFFLFCPFNTQIVGWIAEQGSFARTMSRQIFHKHAKFQATVFDAQGKVVLKIDRPMWLVKTSMVGETHRRRGTKEGDSVLLFLLFFFSSLSKTRRMRLWVRFTWTGTSGDANTISTMGMWLQVFFFSFFSFSSMVTDFERTERNSLEKLIQDF